MNNAYFNIFYLLTLPILGQKLVDSADLTGLVWDYLMNYIYINLFYFQTRLDSHDSAGLDWTPLDSTGNIDLITSISTFFTCRLNEIRMTRLDSSGLDWTQLGIFIELHLYQRDSHDSTGPDKSSSTRLTQLGLFNELRVFHHFLLADSTNFGTKACRLS